jgi:YD repeat-containing protein
VYTVSVPGKQISASFEYDDIDRLVSEEHTVPGTGTSGNLVTSSTYTYSPGGDRLTKRVEKSDGTTTSSDITSDYDYNAGHQLTEVTTLDNLTSDPGETVSFVYDDNGNQTERTVTPAAGSSSTTPVTTNRTDSLGSLVDQYDDTGSLSGARSYDAFGDSLDEPGTDHRPCRGQKVWT